MTATRAAVKLPSILLVEDHQDTRQMYAEFLASLFDVATAADGEEALGLMRGHRPDLLITDLSLPGIDGFALIARMRQDAALGTVPIICLSGTGRHARAAGARSRLRSGSAEALHARHAR